MKNLPVIAITMGDPAGIGPDIILQPLAETTFQEYCSPIIIGDVNFLKKTADLINIPFLTAKIPVIDVKNVCEEISRSRPSQLSGMAAGEYIKEAVRLAMADKVDAIITAPISKEAIHLAGYKYQGHTEMLAELTNTKDYAMMIAGGDIRVVLVTTHVAVKDVSHLINRDNILRIIRLTNRSLKLWGFTKPGMGVSPFNPQGGEAEILGREEIKQFFPAKDPSFACMGIK